MKIKFFALFLLSIDAFSAFASETDSTRNMNHYLDEVVISSYKENRLLKDAPLAASVFSPMRLNRMNITTTQDLSAFVPNFFMPQYGSKLTSPVFIRGIGSTTNAPAIGLYVDGIPYFERGLYDIDLSDVQSVEVLRGPQGTLYGRNTLGGIINVYTKSPFDFKGNRLYLKEGTKGQRSVNFTNYTPIGDKLAFSIDLEHKHHDGYFQNVSRKETSGDLDDLLGKYKLSYRPVSSLSLDLVHNLSYSKQNGYPYARADSTEKHHALHIEANEKSGYTQTVSSTGLALQYKMKGMKLSSSTSYQWFRDNQSIDQDFIAASYFYTTQKMNQNLVSQEINLKSDNRSDYQWIFGTFGFLEGLNNAFGEINEISHTEPYKNSDTHTRSFALYHQSVLNRFLFPGLSLSGGIRYDYEYSSIGFDGNLTSWMHPFDASLHFHEFVPKGNLMYEIDAGNRVYFSLAKGYKAGGFNSYFEKDADKSFRPETSLNYETGYKFSLPGGILSGDLTAFYIDWKNIQVSVSDPTYQNSSTLIVRNLGKAVSKGFEANLIFSPCKNLLLDTQYGYTDATFGKNESTGLGGKNLSMVPKHTFSTTLNRTFPCRNLFDKIVFTASNTALGPIYWDAQNTVKQKVYDILNARLSFYRQNISFAVWGDNLTNTNYDTYYFSNSQLGMFAQRGKPVTGGVEFSVYF